MLAGNDHAQEAAMSTPGHVHDPAPDPVVDRIGELGRSPGLVIGAGVLGMVLGVLILAWPDATIAVIAWLFALHLLATGVVQLVRAFSRDAGAGDRVLLILLGALSILVGLLCLRAPLQTALVLWLLVGAIWVIDGVIGVVLGITGERGAARGWAIASGVLLVVVGAIVLLYPSASLVTMTSLLGVVLVVDGAFVVIRGFSSRRSAGPVPTADGTRSPASEFRNPESHFSS
jgi:uncharacterized membrane protein HdeD (DUF308 family)